MTGTGRQRARRGDRRAPCRGRRRYRRTLPRRCHGQTPFLTGLAGEARYDRGSFQVFVKIAAQHGLPVTVVGGQTGTCGGAIASDGGIALSLERMNRIEEVDTVSMALTVEAGCILQTAQEAVEAEGAFLPLDLGSRGSATIGGCIAANAGGNRVLRWGMMRDMVIGLEVVLADGTIVSSLTKMIKDNAGFAWKHLMIGSEGTLGVITRAVLRLRPAPVSEQTALVALPSFEAVTSLLRNLEVGLGGQLSSFELMWSEFYEAMTEAQLPARARPMELGHPFYALVEMLGGDPARRCRPVRARALAPARARHHRRRRDRQVRTGARGAVGGARGHAARAWCPCGRSRSTTCRWPCNTCRSSPPRCASGYPPPGPARASGLLWPRRRRQSPPHRPHRAGRRCPCATRWRAMVYRVVNEVGGSIAAEHGIGTSRAPLHRPQPLAGRAGADAPAQTGARSRRHTQSRQGSCLTRWRRGQWLNGSASSKLAG